MCVALFNVVNYICEEEALSTFFTSIAGNLRQGGLLIFDCWNGAAALLDPPGSKMYEQQSDGHRVSCHLASLTELSSKITTLNYQIDLFDSSGRKIESESHSIKHKLWTPEQIKAAICEAGFTLERLCLPFRFDHAATDSDWKIMFVCLRSDS
jgi:hypothetical protein